MTILLRSFVPFTSHSCICHPYCRSTGAVLWDKLHQTYIDWKQGMESEVRRRPYINVTMRRSSNPFAIWAIGYTVKVMPMATTLVTKNRD